MVGHFLHPHRKTRSSSSNSNNTNSNNNNNASSPNTHTNNPTTNNNNNMDNDANSNPTMSSTSSSPGMQNTFRSAMHQPPPAAAAPSPSYMPPQNLTAEAVAALPPPGLSGPSALVFSPKNNNNNNMMMNNGGGGKNNNSSSSDNNNSSYLVFVSTSTKTTTSRRLRDTGMANTSERQLCSLDLGTFTLSPLLRLPSKRRFEVEGANAGASASAGGTSTAAPTPAAAPNSNNSGGSSNNNEDISLDERLRRERQRLHSSGGLTQFSWCWTLKDELRLLVPIRGSLYVQDGMDSYLKLVYDKHSLEKATPANHVHNTGAIDAQLCPNGLYFAFCSLGELWVGNCDSERDRERETTNNDHFHHRPPPIQITFGADLQNSITHGLADFVAQEEMDRYRGFWWAPDSSGILFAQVDESQVPAYRITHHETDNADSTIYEDHRYPFAGKANPKCKLGYVKVNGNGNVNGNGKVDDPAAAAAKNFQQVLWWDPPREAQEYLARVTWLPDGSACAQWENRTQNCLVLTRMDFHTLKSKTLLVERSDAWINLHHMLEILPRPIHPHECQQDTTTTSKPSSSSMVLPSVLPHGSFSFLFASERTGFSHLYLYTFIPGYNGEQAILLRQVSGGDWMVESIVGVDLPANVVYVTGTYDSVLERHLYALPIFHNQTSSSYQQQQQYPQQPVETASVEFMPGAVPGTMQHPGGERDPPASSNNPNGVRRGLKQVMNALSGKSSSPSSSSSSSSRRTLAMEYTPEGYVVSPIRLTPASGMHSVVMDPDCTMFVDTSSDLGRPTSVKIYQIPQGGPFANYSMSPTSGNGSGGNNSSSSGRRKQQPSPMATDDAPPKSQLCDVRLVYTLYDAVHDDKSIDASDPTMMANLPAPELLTFPSSDGTETLHAALYRPDARIHGPGPYPLICAVYGGPHVQRVNKSWSQCADMRAQRLRSLGFCVVKCDNRGSSRRGLQFESAISRRLGRLEVLDQVAVVRQLTVRGVADPTRVGIYGWSYGGYLSAMCLCRAPDVFHVAVAGAPVTSWDGYDTHYTERYMGLPSENPNGYRESAVFDHVPNMRGKLLLVHGLIDENVHFRHTARLINRLIASGKDYDLLLFPDERHSPRRLRDRIYMEQRISDYFLKHLGNSTTMRAMAGL